MILLTPFEEKLRENEFVGIVEDNEDPDKKGRCRIRVPYLHGEKKDIPTENIPWSQPNRETNGISSTIPSINKVVNVTFPSGNLYYSVYNNVQHLDPNLQKKIEEYSDDAYTDFIALCYNHNTQIFVDKDKGLFIQHKEQRVNIHEGGIVLDLEDNNSKLVLGDENSDQESVLGTHWMKWFDSLIKVLMNPYIGNNGAPVTANPDLINCLNQYNLLRTTFLSKHVYVVDNDKIQSNNISTEEKIGDKFTVNNKPSTLTFVNSKLNVPTNSDTEQHIATSSKATPAQRREDIGKHIDEEIQNNDKYPTIEKIGDVNNNNVNAIKTVNKPIPTGNISVYVTYDEAIYSKAAVNNGLDNTPTPEHLENMKHVARTIFDPVYEYMLAKYGIKIRVNSFYRNPDVDYKVQLLAVEKGQAKSAKYANSQHTKGQAIDMNAGKYNKELFYYVKNNFQFDQMLWEFGSNESPNWVHVSNKNEGKRNQIAQMKSGGKFILYQNSSIAPEDVA